MHAVQLENDHCFLIHCWQFWPDYFSVCTVRRELFFLHEKNTRRWPAFSETLHVNTVHPPHNLSRHAAVQAFPAFPTIKTPASIASSALPHDHQLGLGSILIFLSTAVLTQSPAPCLHVVCVFSDCCRLWAFPPIRPRDQYIFRTTTNPDLLRTRLTVLSSAVLTLPPASVFCASSLTGAVCEYARL